MSAETKAMNKIVREHYPVDKLPEDLRQGLPHVDTVTVSLEAEPEVMALKLPHARIAHFSQWKELRRSQFASTEEIVSHVRALRDEWDRR